MTEERLQHARYSRTRLLVGDAGLQRLADATAAVFGLGGVGSYAAEALARAGVGKLILVDFDTVEASNQNRQLVALESTVGRAKVEVATERIRDINPDIEVEGVKQFVGPETLDKLLSAPIDCAIDAIDTVASKIELLAGLHTRNIPSVACMGAANKLDPTGIRVADIGETEYCPLARAVRLGLRKRGIRSGILCVYSHENRATRLDSGEGEQEEGPPRKRHVQGSISYVPGIVGLTAAGVAIRHLVGDQGLGRAASEVD